MERAGLLREAGYRAYCSAGISKSRVRYDAGGLAGGALSCSGNFPRWRNLDVCQPWHGLSYRLPRRRAANVHAGHCLFLFGVLVYAFSTDGDDNRPHVNG